MAEIEYCKANELLVGDIGGLDGLKDTFITMASEEIDGMVGFVYALPLPVLSLHVGLVIKNIARKLASGRLLLSQAAGGEDSQVHAYGQSLIDEAFRDLWAIRNGTIDLGVPKITVASTGDAPTIIEGDAVSGVDAYYAWMNNTPGRPRPRHVLVSDSLPSGNEWAPGG